MEFIGTALRMGRGGCIPKKANGDQTCFIRTGWAPQRVAGSGGERRRTLANTGLRFSPVEHEENATKLGKWVAFIIELVGEILDTETARIDVSASENPNCYRMSWSSRRTMSMCRLTTRLARGGTPL